MLKRNGESCKYTVPDFVGRLTSAEFDAYNEAFGAIKEEFAALERIKDSVKKLTANPGASTIPDGSVSSKSIVVPDAQSRDVRWEVRSRLLKLDYTDVILCESATKEDKQFAVIECYQNDSSFALANGNAAVILVSDDPVQAVQDYAANAAHTLRFMASDMVATAQSIIWERYANQNPSRVIRAISERCGKAVDQAQNEIQVQILEQKLAQRQSVGQSV